MYRKPHLLISLILPLGLSFVSIAGAADPSLVLKLPFDEGKEEPQDVSMYKHTVERVNDPAWVEGQSGSALEFNGSNYVQVPITDALQLVETFTAEFWVKRGDTQPATWNYMVAAGSLRWAIIFNASDDSIYVWSRSGGTWGQRLKSTQALSTDWTHIAVTYDTSSGIVLYLNGEKADEDATPPVVDEIDGAIMVGARNPGSEFFTGLIDSVFLYNRILSPKEIARDMRDTSELSSNPLPESEATDVQRNVVLSWEPGEFALKHNVYFGTVFDDVNTADRTNPLDVLVSEGQNTSALDVGILEFGQTYYWRVDEVNGAPDNTVFKGDLWSFEVEPFSIPVETITATASSSNAANMGPENTINGVGLDALDQHSTEGTEMWLSGIGDPTPSIQYEFDKAYKLHEMWVWNSNQLIESFVGIGAKDVVIEYSTDGIEWMVLEAATQFAQAPGSPTYTANTAVDFGGALAQHVRITVTAGWGMLPQYGISEVRFLYIPTLAREPMPADGETTEGVDVVLDWRAGREAATHQVYLGTDAANLPMRGTTDESSYDAGALDYDTTYYWQIVEVNEAETPTSHTGNTWRFTTPAFGIVDSFDLYDDNCNRIFFAWEDGLGHNGGAEIEGCDVAPSNGNGGGSIVGNSMAPFAEQAIVYAGTQSLPLMYDNAFGASEAKLSFAAQDWTASGIKTLALSLFGDPDNTGQLYLKINNTKVVYDGDATDIRRTLWQPWNVDLASVGGNLQHVSSLSIGVEGANAAGIVYIDSIGLYPQAPEFITPEEPDSASLLVHYAFDGNVLDSSGQGVDGEEMGAPTYGGGVDGQAIQLNGIDDYVNLVLDVPEDGYTAAFWFNTSNPDCGLYAVVVAPLSGENDRHIFLVDGDISVRVWNNEIITAAGSQVADGQWHHVAHTFGDDVGGQRLYIDGLLQASGTKAQSDFDWQERVHFGWSSDAANDFMEGMIDDGRIYDRTLTPAEIAWLAGSTEPMAKPF